MTTFPDLTIAVTSGVATFRSPFNAALIAEVKGIPGRRWNPDSKVWTVRVNAVSRAAVVDLAARAGRVSDPEGALTPAPSLTLPEVDAVEVPDTDAARLRSHQAQLVAAVQGGARRVLLADEPGLGKTAQALIGVAAAKAYPAVVVCPSVVKTAWTREAARWTPAARVTVLTGRKPNPDMLNDVDVAVINYEILSGWADTLTAWQPKALILDEAHYAKDSRTARGKAALTLAETVRGRDGLVMCLTGTPVPNHVIDLTGPLSALGWLDDLGGFFGFAKRYCGAFQGSHGWVMTGASNLDELHARLRELGLVRRVKADLADLPERTVVDLPVALEGQGSRDVRAAEKALITVLVQAVKAAANSQTGEAQRVTKTFVRQAVACALAASGGGAVDALARLRKALGQAKAPLIADQARSLVEDSGKVVVFAHHRSVQETVANALSDLGVVRITGGQDAATRQTSIDRFQNDPEVRVCVASIKAAGLGITLHAAHNIVLGELPWSAADQDQAIDRVHRLGQDQPVTAWRVLAAGTFDERLADLIGTKAAVSKAVMDGAGYDAAAARADRRARVDALVTLVLADKSIVRLRAGLAEDEDADGWDERSLAVMAALLDPGETDDSVLKVAA